jgi:general secretion pathway protein G
MRTGTNRHQRGFTLIELMVVIVIMGGLIGIVGVNVIGSMAEAQINEAETQMHAIYGAVGMYALANRGELPSDLAVLTVPSARTGESYLPRIPQDPWGGSYELRRLDVHGYEIVSAGRDTQPGTEDDLRWRKPSDE